MKRFSRGHVPECHYPGHFCRVRDLGAARGQHLAVRQSVQFEGVAGAKPNGGRDCSSAGAPRDRFRIEPALALPQQNRNPSFHLLCPSHPSQTCARCPLFPQSARAPLVSRQQRNVLSLRLSRTAAILPAGRLHLVGRCRLPQPDGVVVTARGQDASIARYGRRANGVEVSVQAKA